MARQPEKINAVITLLGEGKTPKEIMEETGCSGATVTVARKRLKDREGDLAEATADIEGDVDENVDRFIKSIKIKPDTDVLTKDGDKEEIEDTDYECPGCGHEWSAGTKDRQESCPNCGMEFE